MKRCEHGGQGARLQSRRRSKIGWLKSAVNARTVYITPSMMIRGGITISLGRLSSVSPLELSAEGIGWISMSHLLGQKRLARIGR